MKREALENPRCRQEELGQFPTAMPVVDFTASMLEQLPSAPRINPKDRHGILVKAIIEVFCARWYGGATILGIRNTKRNLIHLNSKALAALGIKLDLATNLPDVIVHHPAKNWLLLMSDGPIAYRRLKQLKDFFSGCICLLGLDSDLKAIKAGDFQRTVYLRHSSPQEVLIGGLYL